MEIAFLIGRILFGGFFVMNGFNHLTKTGMMAGYASSKNVPMVKLAVIFTGLMILLGGAGIVLGVYIKLSVILLVVFLFVVSFKMHNFWAIDEANQKMMEMVNFTKNMALLGAALMILMVPAPWAYSLFKESPIAEKPNLIKVFSPKPNESVASPLVIKGEARGFWFFEASFPVKLFDDNGFLLGIKPAQASKEWMTENFVPFEAEMPFSIPSSRNGILVLEKDNPSSLPEHADELRFEVAFQEFSEPKETVTTKIFLSDSRFAEELNFDCGKTVAAKRTVQKTQAIGRAAIEALLRGPDEQEIQKGLISNINPGVRVQSLEIENDAAKIDFDKQLEFQVGGSCRVAAIRAQITDTLKQFSTIKNVIISIDRRTEDILQP